MLGAQAQTRWKIVGAGAKSLQTQEVFANLVKAVVAQDDDVVAVRNMRTAIKNTNVVLNLAILPGLILVPSDLLILKEMVVGYNNTFTLATKAMTFGVNDNINYVAPKVVTPVVSAVPAPVVTRDRSTLNRDLGIVFTVLGIVGGLAAWLL